MKMLHRLACLAADTEVRFRRSQTICPSKQGPDDLSGPAEDGEMKMGGRLEKAQRNDNVIEAYQAITT
jgi:hypothetical protein